MKMPLRFLRTILSVSLNNYYLHREFQTANYYQVLELREYQNLAVNHLDRLMSLNTYQKSCHSINIPNGSQSTSSLFNWCIFVMLHAVRAVESTISTQIAR